MKVIIKTLLLIVFFVSCSPSKHSSVDLFGIYKQEGNSNVKLILNENEFVYIDPYTNDLALYTCCDTITKGTWVKENNLLCLSTPQLKSTLLDIYVDELSEMPKDTLYFYLQNPIEEYYRKMEVKNRDIYYRVSITEKNGNLLDSWVWEFDTNEIKILKPKGIFIAKFSISIYPKANFGGRNIGTKEISTLEYKLKSYSSNLFKINIPQLTYEFMSYLRLNRDFVRIINTNKLEWNGFFYTKE